MPIPLFEWLRYRPLCPIPPAFLFDGYKQFAPYFYDCVTPLKRWVKYASQQTINDATFTPEQSLDILLHLPE